MKRILFYFLVMLMFLSCDRNCVENVNCIVGFDEVVFSQSALNFGVVIPTIIINDNPDYGLYAISVIDEDLNRVFPQSIKFEVFDADNKLIFVNEEVSAADSLHKMTLLWDGVIEDVPYNGIVSFKLFVQLNSELNVNTSGRVEVLSCNKLTNCITGNINCALADCWYYGQLIGRLDSVLGTC